MLAKTFKRYQGALGSIPGDDTLEMETPASSSELRIPTSCSFFGVLGKTLEGPGRLGLAGQAAGPAVGVPGGVESPANSSSSAFGIFGAGAKRSSIAEPGFWKPSSWEG